VKREEKEAFVNKLHEKLLNSNSFILTDYRGLKVGEINLLRNELKKLSVEYRVVKNTLLSRAAEGTQLAMIKEYFTGPTAIAIGRDDPVGPAKIFVNFMKSYPKLELKIGLYNGKTLDPEYIKDVISKLPSREELIGKVIFLLNSPIGRLIQVLRGIPLRLIGTIMAIKEKREALEQKNQS
jgi:large subunit ribosomal protein L10